MLIDDVITRDDVTGCKGGSRDCPVARLLKRHGFPNVSVGMWSVLPDASLPNRVYFSREVELVVKDFDSGKSLVGRRVVIEIPQEML